VQKAREGKRSSKKTARKQTANLLLGVGQEKKDNQKDHLRKVIEGEMLKNLDSEGDSGDGYRQGPRSSESAITSMGKTGCRSKRGKRQNQIPKAP